MYHSFFTFIRRHVLIFAVLLMMVIAGIAVVMSFSSKNKRATLTTSHTPQTGGFFIGAYFPSVDQGTLPQALSDFEDNLQTRMDVVSFYQAWGPKSIEEFPMNTLKDIRRRGSIPLITWEPWTSTFPEFTNDAQLGKNRKVFTAIQKGRFDAYLEAYATKIREFGEPVFIRFAHEPDNPLYPWSYTGENSPEEFIYAWRYVVSYFDKVGASNVAWVWNPWEEANVRSYYPGDAYVDWIGVTALNYGLAARDGTWHDFYELYDPFRYEFVQFKKPVMLSEFGSVPYGGDRAGWIRNAFSAIQTSFPEIRALVFFQSDQDMNWATQWRPETGETTLQWSFAQSSSTIQVVRDYLRQEPYTHRPFLLQTSIPFRFTIATPSSSSPFVKGKEGDFQLFVDGQPYFIQGVAYNPGHDWRDGYTPLTRKRLERDFLKIKEMGANTIRRYGLSPYDRNILTISTEIDLKVLFGFWFEQNIDYYTDFAARERYTKEILDFVQSHAQNPTILGWGLGNEVWGLLKHSYTQPYLTLVRHAYTSFLESLALKIRSIDSRHPLFAIQEHADELPRAILDFRDLAPTIDVLGVNSYYQSHIQSLQNLMTHYYPGRPYLISEFGPDGYWDKLLTNKNTDGSLNELTGTEAAHLYTLRWKEFIQDLRGYTIGGVAYAFRDRMEGTLTWFGLTDTEDRLKPAYYALKNAWSHDSSVIPLPSIQRIISNGKTFLPGTFTTFKIQLLPTSSIPRGVEWNFYEDGTFRPFDHLLFPSRDSLSASLTLPHTSGAYRISVTVYDDNGNADTASLPVTIISQ